MKINIVHIEDPSGRPIEEVYEGVHSGRELGQGVTGIVRLVTHRATGVQYAVKCLDLTKIETEEGLQRICEEICILSELDHPNIGRLEEVYESQSKVYLVQELCLGRELLDRLDEQPEYFTEERCASLVEQMLCSVRYLHSKGIVHRDLKLENFLFSSEESDAELKLIDFGFSKHFRTGEIQHEATGTPYTIAPEIIHGSYDEKCDIWAIGVITYLILSGHPPFGSCDRETCLGGCQNPGCMETVRRNILSGSLSFDPGDWYGVSAQARDFIRMLLESNPHSRPSAEEAQRHPWLRSQSHQRGDTFNNGALNPTIVKALVEFKDCSESQRLLCEALSFSLLPEQVKHLRKEFGKLDVDGTGEVSFSALKGALWGQGLTEEEAGGIFNAMLVSKRAKSIHWHEFIASVIPQCRIDRRNLLLTFDKVDAEHKGYITFDNCIKMLGKDANQYEDTMRRMWGGTKCAFYRERITFTDWQRIVPPTARGQ